MPKAIQSYASAACKRLIASDADYITITKIDIAGHADEASNNWNKEHQPKLQLEDAIVCNNTCLHSLISLKGK